MAQDDVIPSKTSDRTDAVNASLNALEESEDQNTSSASTIPQKALPPTTQITPAPSTKAASGATSPSGDYVKISGDVHLGMGIDANGNTIFTRANADLNERNYRVLSSDAYNENINTYDPAIYSRLKVVMDASVAASVVSVHMNVSVDPWSYTGKSNTMTVTSASGWGDTAKVQYLFWGNTGYTVNSIVNTLNDGDAFAIPELKVKDNTVPAISVTSQYGDTFNIPAAHIDYTFFPFREAWVDIKPTDDIKLRLFPMGYQDQALTSDDPLKLSNNKIFWEESPWIDGWAQGNLNAGANPVTFTKGQWDRTLAFFTRDSDGVRLTALRGASLDLKPTDETTVDATIATPKTIWQDYGDVTALPASMQVKQFIGDLFYVGAIGNMHLGYDPNEQLDAENYVGGVDTGFIPVKWLKVSAELAGSQSRYDETSSEYESKYKGNAYFLSLESTSNPEDLINKDYFTMNPIEKTDAFYKTRLYFTRMDNNFESSLSTYHQTRDDSYWSDHLTFYPSDYRYMPGDGPGQSEYDLNPYAIGNGVDYGRTVFGWRGDTDLMDDKVQGLVDFRHVMNDIGDDIENVARTQWTYEATDRLTTKGLLLLHDLPKTVAGVDPFAIDGDTGQNLTDNTVVSGKNADLSTSSLGARYALTDWAALNGVWEYTNDFTLGTDEFPQAVLNPLPWYTNFLYDQGYFEQAPYAYHNVFKSGFELTPTEAWHIYLNYTRNPYKFAGSIDDNMNHVGIESSYLLNSKIGFFARYTYSQGYDINRLINDNNLDYRGYNDVFFEIRMILPKEVTMSLQYGVGPSYDYQTSNTNPSLTFYATHVVETQHIVRIVFDKKF